MNGIRRALFAHVYFNPIVDVVSCQNVVLVKMQERGSRLFRAQGKGRLAVPQFAPLENKMSAAVFFAKINPAASGINYVNKLVVLYRHRAACDRLRLFFFGNGFFGFRLGKGKRYAFVCLLLNRIRPDKRPARDIVSLACHARKAFAAVCRRALVGRVGVVSAGGVRSAAVWRLARIAWTGLLGQARSV